MRYTSKLLICSLSILCLFPSMAEASDWVEALRTDNVLISIDRNSLRRTGTKVRTWVKWEWAVARESLDGARRKYTASKELSIYNCAERSTHTVQAIRYADNEMQTVVEDVSVKDVSSSYYEVVPDSIGEALLEFSCNEIRGSARK